MRYACRAKFAKTERAPCLQEQNILAKRTAIVPNSKINEENRTKIRGKRSWQL